MTRRAVAAALSVLVLAGCGTAGTGSRVDLRADVRQITAQANARDAAGVRAGVDSLLRRIDAALASGQLSSADAARLRATAQSVRTAADTIDAGLLARQQAEQAARDAQLRLQEQAQNASRTPVPTPSGKDKGKGHSGDEGD